MIGLAADFTGMIVIVSMALFLAAVAVLCVTPLFRAIIENPPPEMLALPPVLEYLGFAVALAGLTFRVTEIAAVGVGDERLPRPTRRSGGSPARVERTQLAHRCPPGQSS